MIRHSIVVTLLFLSVAATAASDGDGSYEQLIELIRQKDIGYSELQSAITSLDSLCEKDADIMARVVEDVKKHLLTVKKPNQRANVLSVLIAAENLCRDQRQLRQWIDDLVEIVETEELSPDCRCQCLFAIGGKEFMLGNLVDAEKTYAQLEEEAEEQGNDEALAESLDFLGTVYLRKGDRKMYDHVFKKKLIILRRLSSCPKAQAKSYASSAMDCAVLREWRRFDEMCEKSVEADGGKELCDSLLTLLFFNVNALVGKDIAKQVAIKGMPLGGVELWSHDEGEVFSKRRSQLSRDSRYVLYMENNFIVSDFVRMAIGGGFSLVEFNKISEKLYGYRAKGKSVAEPMGDSGLNLLLDLIMIEVKINKGVPCVDLQEELKRLKPAPFEIMQTKYSVEDAEALLLQVQLCVSQRLGDLKERCALARKMELLLGKVTKPFTTLLSRDCKAKLAEVWIEQGKIREGFDLLLPVGKEYMGAHVFDLMVYYNLGRACRCLGSLNDAELLLSEAYHFVRPHGHSAPNGYSRNACFYGADVCVEYAALLAAKQSDQDKIDTAIELAIKLALTGGHPDALGRAYQTAMNNLFKNSEVSRKDKLGKIEKMKADCLSATSNPLLLASFFYNSAKFEYENNMSAKMIVKEIEQYFHYQQLFAELTDVANLSSRDSEMREMLLSLLGEMDDVAVLDYWSKVVEKRKTRSAEIALMTVSQDGKASEFIPLLVQISKYEAASEILSREQVKPERSRDQVLLAKATMIKRELERNFDEAQKTLSPENVKRLRDLLTDGFIIHPDSMGQLCSVLPDDVVCLQFLAVGEKIVVYLAAKGATPFVTMIELKDKGLTGKQLTSNIVKIRSKIQNGVGVKSLNQDLKILYEILFADIRQVLEKLKCRRVIVNSSGQLRYVPFAALYDGEKYLVERYQISNVTGLDLVRLAKSVPRRDADSVVAMVFADPDGSLPSGRAEGKRVAGLFKNSQLLIGEKASIANFESMLGNVNFIHLATHAVLDSDNPKNSFVLFAEGRQWRYCDMMGFCVENVDSIVLSACSTAVGEKSDGGEIEGMAYQLLRKSPCGSVLASFWKVDDAATEKLMSVYYNHIANAMRENGSLDRGGALREAQLALLRSPETASPYYWASFSLFGDFR